MSFQIKYIKPHPLIRDYVENLFFFENDGVILNDDLRLIVPNGLIKLVVPLNNGLVAQMNGRHHYTNADTAALIGISDVPSIVDTQKEGYSASLTVEFKPWGAYRFFDFSLNEIKNTVCAFTDVLGKDAHEMEEQINSVGQVDLKIAIIQKFLIRKLRQENADAIFDHCVQKIVSSNGKVTIRQLEKDTGFSSRWLSCKFNEKLGISPKNIASIIRFQQMYTVLTRKEPKFHDKAYYDLYFDQSHFIKDFKRFTGLTPKKFLFLDNEYDKVFYNQ